MRRLLSNWVLMGINKPSFEEPRAKRQGASHTTTAQRLSCVLGMLSSLEVKVLRPT